MYNLNDSCMSGPPLLGVDGGVCTVTPRTPEILNSLIAMTNPLEYSFPSHQHKLSRYDSHSSCSGSPLDSPAGTNAPPSVQKTCSQLIKAGLKLSLEMKRKMSSGGDSSGTENTKIAKMEFPDSSDDDDDMDSKSPRFGLTPEDEDRRRRRRERNKIAATKCRMKKRERTMNLVSESAILETQHVDLKTQMRSLVMERQKLMEMLQSHAPTCVRPEGIQTPTTAYPSQAISKYMDDHEQHLQQSQNQQPIPSVNTIKFSHNSKAKAKRGVGNDTHHSQPHLHLQTHQSSSLDIGFSNKPGLTTPDITAMLSPNYCKPSPTATDVYALSPDSGFIKSPVDMVYVVPNNNNSIGSNNNMMLQHQHQQLKSDYIPNCDHNSNGDADVSEFALKCEMVDSPYTTVQSADRFLFDGTDNNFDNSNMVIESNRGLKININNNSNHLHNQNNNNNITSNNNNTNHNTTTIIEFTSQCQSFDGHMLKSDIFSHNSEFLALTDGSETQFTDLDSGITTYNHIVNNNSGCLA